uniref:IFT81_CH domain-containing protein n=1 Tax=Rhabditophanes sp. KR3021 TaxID=114890 RepID=A0AC35TTK2_9BILA
MSVDTIKLIVSNLNEPPFSKNYNLINFDLLTNEKLVQLVSDVVCWLDDMDPFIDIRSESAESTMIRIFEMLGKIKFNKAPKGGDELREWRTKVVEGTKSVIYQILYFIFEDKEAVKERAYKSQFISKIPIPYDQKDDEVILLEDQLNSLIKEFKLIFKAVRASHTESLMVVDIERDLKTMANEKEQLLKRLDKTMRKTSNISDINKYLKMAKEIRLADEERTKMKRLRLEQDKLNTANIKKTQRLSKQLADTIEDAREMDPTAAMTNIEEEISSLDYMLKGKLEQENIAKQEMINELSKIVNMKSVTQSDIYDIQQEINEINNEIVNLISKRDNDDEATDEKLSMFRHQAANVEKRKEVFAEELHGLLENLKEVEEELDQKKESHLSVTGGVELVSSHQFKEYQAALRAKNHVYKKKTDYFDYLKQELLIASRSEDVFKKYWDKLKKSKEAKGEHIIEIVSEKGTLARPKTAKSRVQNLDELKSMIKSLEEENAKKIQEASDLSKTLNDLYHSLVLKNSNYNASIQQIQERKQRLERGSDDEKMILSKLEGSFERLTEDIDKKRAELKLHSTYVDKIGKGGFFEELEKQQADEDRELQELQEKCEKLYKKKNLVDQKDMWTGLNLLFEAKVKVLSRGN